MNSRRYWSFHLKLAMLNFEKKSSRRTRRSAPGVPARSFVRCYRISWFISISVRAICWKEKSTSWFIRVGYLLLIVKLLYFEWSPPWHVGWRLSGEGCHWEYDGKNGEFENIDFRFPWLSDTSEMGFGHDVPFLNYSDRLPHPSDLCQPDWVRWG